MGWKRALRNYFTFNRRERRGVIALLVILFILVCIQLWLKLTPQDPQSLADLDPDQIFRSDTVITSMDEDSAKRPAEWSRFDPNQALESSLIAMGMSPSVAGRLVQYRAKGGSFSGADDLLKLYGIDSQWVALAEPYMDFPEVESEKPSGSSARKKEDEQQKAAVDLNRADTNALKSIRGIGSYYAREVILLRDRLGGFLSYDQLLDVYNMRDDAITILSENTFIDPKAVKKININSCPVDPLGRHPYLSWKQAKVIVSYRQQHGAYSSTEEILQTKVVPDSVYRKIAPYLTTE